MRLLPILVLVSLAAGQVPPRNFLNEGVAAFKAAKYREAVELFRQAASAEPSNPVPRLYLGTAYLSQYIPGADTPENRQMADTAEREFQAVLALQSENVTAIESLASLNYHRAQGTQELYEKVRLLDEAAQWYGRLIGINPEHKTAHYSLGVIAWAKFYPQWLEARRQSGLKPEDPGPIQDASIRDSLRTRVGDVVEAGIQHLERALQVDPAYDDAMAYMNLLIRERADLHESTQEYARDIAAADEWVQKALQTKKLKAEQSLRAQPVPQQIRIGGNVQGQKLIDKPVPEYPEAARQARIQGVVKLNVVVGKDGTVANVSLISGHPLLVPPAVEAVRRYRYQPTLLNGQPVEVATAVDVTFTLTE